MADGTHIEWTDATWQIVTGCSVISPGCTNCYAMRLAGTRLKHHRSREGLTIDTKAGPVWNGQVRFNADQLTQPLRWKRPRRIFVAAHGDLFHDGVTDEQLDQIFAVMALCPQHTFQVLTKRAGRMRDYLTAACGRIADTIIRMRRDRGDGNMVLVPLAHVRPGAAWWPLRNVWLGVSAEDQRRFNERVFALRHTPAAVRWVSAEPLLGAIDATRADDVGTVATDTLRGVRVHPTDELAVPGDEPLAPIDWIVAGGESGPGSRPMHPDAARQLRDQCAAAGVAFLFKQWGDWGLGVGDDAYRARCATAEHVQLPPMHRTIGPTLYRVGKKVAGRVLDGQIHDAYPKAAD